MRPLDADEPRAIGPYRLLGRLGAGGMGRVYLARSEGGRTVAVKVVHPHFALDGEFRARFRREVASARKAGGRWTAPVLDADPDAPVPWVATGYVPGPSLARAVTEYGPLPGRTVRALGAGLAEALEAVHGLGLVHRDVKPSNVLLALGGTAREGDPGGGPCLIDFGIARATDGTTSLTSTGVPVGSPGYMAPEQILGKGVTGAADVFSLGAVLAYAATGAPPFPGDSPAVLLYKVVHEEPELGEALTGELRELVTACLAKDPAARPAPGEVARRLAPGGAAALVAGGWLPGPVVEQAGRDAVRLLHLEPAREGHASGPVPFGSPATGAFGPPVDPPSGGPPPPADSVPDGAPGAVPPPRGPLSLSVGATSEPVPGRARGRRLSCTVALAVAGALAAVTVGGTFLFRLLDEGDARDGGRAPTASGPPATPADERPVTSVPKEFLGTWKGPTREAGGLPHGDLTVVITGGGTGRDVVRMTTTLTVLGVTAECHGVGRLTSATTRKLEIADRTDPERPGSSLCTGEPSTLRLRLDEDGSLLYRSDEEAAGRPSGTLTRVAP